MISLKNIPLLLFTSVAFLFPKFSWAESYDYSSTNYSDAKKSESYLKFEMASTKVGLFTTHFTGYAKKFSVSGNKKQNLVSDATVEFNVDQLDTDTDGRNEKMWNHCLDISHHPKVSIKLKESISIDGVERSIPAIINLRGEDHAIQLVVKATKEENKLLVDIKGELSIKELNIPDPSIAIASVRDAIDISAHIVIEEK